MTLTKKREGDNMIPRLGILLAIVLSLTVVTPAFAAGQNVLTWVDNSSNEDSFLIQRTGAANPASCSFATGWATLTSVGPNVITFTDNAVVEGLTYCYRVAAVNAGGVSDYSNIGGRTVPFAVPIPTPPSGLTIN